MKKILMLSKLSYLLHFHNCLSFQDQYEKVQFGMQEGKFTELTVWTLRPQQNEQDFEDIFKCIFFNENVLKFE